MDNFKAETRELKDGSILHIINIESINNDLEKFIDKNLPLLHSGGEYDLEETKILLRETFKGSLPPPDVKMGMIAEYYIHLYLINLGFKQECLAQNLEEHKSVKKGFDGYYSLNGEMWLMESKASRSSVEHTHTLALAYKDLSNKVSGKSKDKKGNLISPWNNALNHAKRVNSDESIVKNIKQLSKDFIHDKYYDISIFNIMPSSTIFLGESFKLPDHNEIHKKIDIFFECKKYAKLHAVCITQKTVDTFLEYLNK